MRNLKLLLAILIAVLMPFVAFADIYVAQGQEIEIKIPSRDLSVNRYYITSAREPHKILRFGKLDKKDKNTRRAKVYARKWDPGLYNIHYVSGEVKREEILFISPSVYYASPKLSSVLRQAMYFSDRNDKETLRYFAKKRDLELNDEDLMVNVELRINESKRGEIIKLVNDLGGGIKNFSANLLNIRVPLAALSVIAKSDAVYFVYVIDKGDSDWVIATSEGVEDLKANLWHLAGYKGKGIKIAIVDGSFAGYGRSIARGELPQNVITKNFDPYRSFGDQSDTHGLECAEIVYDIAPEAQLYLLQVDESDSTTQAVVDYIIKEDIDVVSRSQSCYQGPFDGTSKRSQLINKAKESGVVWVNSVGNRAKTHWEGYFNPKGGHAWNGSDTRMAIEQGEIKLRLAWNDWGHDENGYPSGNAHGQDLALILYCNGFPVDQSDNPQLNPAVDPYEELSFKADDGNYEIGISASNYDPAFPIYLELFQHGSGSFEYAMAQSSVTIGGDAAGAIAVGAVQVYSHQLADYSSQGPTNGLKSGPPDNTSLIRPDVCGITDTQTSLSFFGGTSAATPHIAGLAALVKQYLSSNGQNEVAPDEVKQYLETHTKKLLGVAEKNNQTGNGLVILDDQNVIAGIVPPESEGPIIYDSSFINSIPSQFMLGMKYIWGKNIKSGAELKFLGTSKPNYYYLAKDRYTGLVQIAIHQPETSADAKLGTEEIEVINFDGKSAKFYKYEILPLKVMILDSIQPEVISPGFKGNLIFKASDDYPDVFEDGLEIIFAPKIEVDEKNIVIADPKTLIVPVKIPYDFYDAYEIAYLIKNPNGRFVMSDPYLGGYSWKQPLITLIPSSVPVMVSPPNANRGWKGKIGVSSGVSEVESGYKSKDGFLLNFGKGINLDPNSYIYEGAWIYVAASVAQDAEFGFRNVTIYDPEGYVGTFEGGFEIVPLIPEIMSISIAYDFPWGLKVGCLPVEWEGWINIYANNIKEGAVFSLGKGIEIKDYVNFNLAPFTSSFKIKIYISSDTELGMKDLVVTNPDEGSAVYKNIFEVVPKSPPPIPVPAVIKIKPNQIKQGEEALLQIVGDNFDEGSEIDFGSDINLVSSYESGGYNFLTPKQMEAKVKVSDTANLGSRVIVLTNSTGQKCESSIEVIAVLGPWLQAVYPNLVYRGQSIGLSLKGDCFKTGATADFGNGNDIVVVPPYNWPTGYNYDEVPLFIKVFVKVLETAAEGKRSVVVTNPNGQSYTAENILTVSAPTTSTTTSITTTSTTTTTIALQDLPSINSVSPDQVKIGQNTVIKIKGSNFEPGQTSIEFGSALINVKSVNVLNASEIDAEIFVTYPAMQVTFSQSVKLTVKTSKGSAEKENAIVIKAEGAK